MTKYYNFILKMFIKLYSHNIANFIFVNITVQYFINEI